MQGDTFHSLHRKAFSIENTLKILWKCGIFDTAADAFEWNIVRQNLKRLGTRTLHPKSAQKSKQKGGWKTYNTFFLCIRIMGGLVIIRIIDRVVQNVVSGCLYSLSHSKTT